MDEQEVIDLINQYIITNHNNEITAAVLNPILIAIVEQSNDLIGNLNDLTTPENIDLVTAINSLQSQFDDFEFSGVQVYSGVDDPNTTPPLSFNVADFYKQLDGGGNTIALWQYDGVAWHNVSANSVSTLQEVTDAGNTTDNPIIVISEDETRNISYEEDRMVYTNTGGVSRITFSEPVGDFSYNVPAKDADDTFAMLSDISPVSTGSAKWIAKGWVGTTANILSSQEVGDIFQGSFFDVGENKWYWYPCLQWLGGSLTDISNFNWSYRDDFS